jgi:predicted dehydrogenase
VKAAGRAVGRTWREVDTQQTVGVTSPDNVLVSGTLANGGVASVHVASNPWAGSGYRMEIYGRAGTLVVTSEESPNHDGMRLQGARGGNILEDLEVPGTYTSVREGMPRGAPYNVGQLYSQFAQGIRSGAHCEPDFTTAVTLHRLLDTIQEASVQGRAVAIGSGGVANVEMATPLDVLSKVLLPLYPRVKHHHHRVWPRVFGKRDP